MAVEHRVKQTLKLVPLGEDGTLPLAFRVELHTEYQRRVIRLHQQMWLTEKPAERETVIERATRRQVQDLIGECADWLAYDGKD